MSDVIEINKGNALKALKEATGDFKKVLRTLLGKQVDENVMERCNTFEAVCEEAGKDIADYIVNGSMTYKQKADKFMDMLMLLEVVFNEGTPIEIGNTKQRKHYPGHNIIEDEDAPGGFRLSFDVCACAYSYADLGARPYFIKPEHATFCGKTYLWIYEGWAQNFQLSKQNP